CPSRTRYRPTTSATVGSSSTTTIRPGGSGLLTKVSRSSNKDNGYASKVRRQPPVKPVNRPKASPVRKQSDDCVRSGPIGSEETPQKITGVNTEGCFRAAVSGGAAKRSWSGYASAAAIIPGTKGRSFGDRSNFLVRARRLGASGDRAHRRQPQTALRGWLAARKPWRRVDHRPVRGPGPGHVHLPRPGENPPRT